MKPYADTNFLTRLYLSLPGTSEAVQAMDRLGNNGRAALPITWHHRLETINAFQLLVFTSAQSPHQPRVTLEQASVAQANFRGDLSKPTFYREAPLVLSELELQFEELSLRHTAQHGFRTYDLLHVASALALNCDVFWSFDSKALKLASLEGLKIRR
ncbi:MAG TPA: PIN domain-containing protein [Verrucomicrobiae bacterium]|nr:PIN domain-containing protein [Verrucomicrobiae bacterium]